MVRQWLLAGAAIYCALGIGEASADGLLRLTPTEPSPSQSSGSLSPFYGSINPFYGKINPFYGKINPFYGRISPFWGDISPFWGKINPFYGSISPFYGNLDAFWGNLSPFASNPFWSNVGTYWKNAGPTWGGINDSWAQLQAGNATDYSGLQLQLKDFLSQAEAFWAPAVQKATGKNFNDGFASAMLARYGIDPNDPASLANADVLVRSEFFLNWYDGLMSFTGVDHVDWWMPAVHWSPALAQVQGGGHNVIVGLLDSSVFGDNADVANLQFAGGFKTYVNDHGAAVASLIAAQHDGQGIMGVAPNSEVHLYNPFDQTGTASWSDVAQGISTLYNGGAHVVNASLGVPGWTLSKEWVNILTGPLLSNRSHDLIVVKAAGNEGVMQTADLAWLGLQAPGNLLVVGSVGPTSVISPFSNTPGDACFTILGICTEANKLKYRFLVAPGELMLVSDNDGGVARMTGTSFAAPLVTGTVALLQDRWPWLQQHADETVQIILRSAKDLGAPGVDPVYGWGELDIEASQSPLDFNNLTVYQPYTYTGKQVSTPLLVNWSAKSLKSAVLAPGQLNLWQNQKAFIVAFESIGTTFRDFTIPLSSMLVGKDQTVNGKANPFQSYLYQRMTDWANGTKASSFNTQSAQIGSGAWSLDVVATEASQTDTNGGDRPFHSEFVAANRDAGLDLRVGEGSGASALAAQTGFSFRSDFDPSTGGVNPVLGFASGGTYGGAGVALGHGLRLSLGFSEKANAHAIMDPTFGPVSQAPFSASKASASVMGIDYAIADGLSLNAAYTRLGETNSLLGAQGSGVLSLPGARTEAATLGAKASFTGGWQVLASATMAQTAAPAPGQSLFTLSKDLKSTAYELVAAKTGVFADADQFRISLAQPLHVESGALEFHSLQVVDRDTGALGPLEETLNVSGKREYRMEATYGVPVLNGRATIDGFGLVDMNAPMAGRQELTLTVGGQFRLRF